LTGPSLVGKRKASNQPGYDATQSHKRCRTGRRLPQEPGAHRHDDQHGPRCDPQGPLAGAPTGISTPTHQPAGGVVERQQYSQNKNDPDHLNASHPRTPERESTSTPPAEHPPPLPTSPCGRVKWPCALAQSSPAPQECSCAPKDRP